MNISPELARQAMGLVRTGKVYDLSVELGRPGLGSYGDHGGLVSISASVQCDPAGSGKSFRSERVTAPLHHGTHMDMLNHFSEGHASSDPADTDSGNADPIVCRGILVDIAGYLGHAPSDNFVIEPDILISAIQTQHVSLQPGDAVLIRTGKAASFADDPEAAWLSCPGISAECARRLSDIGMHVFGIDTASPDRLPIADWSDTVHSELLVKRKIHIVENLYLEELAQDGIREFLFICAPLRIYQATGAWARPIAIV